MPEFYVILVRKIIKMPEFCWYLSEKNYKIPEFYMICVRKMPEVYIIIARKIFFPDFKGVGARAPLPPSPTLTSTKVERRRHR